ncbi:MAG: DUF4163 domain-containing protein [Deltaproteobacteria bacterium]|jgi:hypothetical protein|nr:DUF4163 domain-containing protein [Deltaproteobacteria bacterium]
MRKTLAAAAFLAASLSLQLHAQPQARPQEGGESEFDRLSPRPEGVSYAKLEDSLSSRRCPSASFSYSVTYPRGLDGGGPIDGKEEEQAREFMAGAKTGMETEIASEDFCEYATETWSHVTSAAFRSAPHVFSVLYTVNSYSGGAHGNETFATRNALPDGTEITLRRLFPWPEISIPLLWEKVYRAFCSLDHENLPNFYGSLPCSSRPQGAPGPFAPDNPLSAAGAVTLNSMGMTFHIAAYDAYSFADGPYTLDIPRAELLRIGADPLFWP